MFAIYLEIKDWDEEDRDYIYSDWAIAEDREACERILGREEIDGQVIYETGGDFSSRSEAWDFISRERAGIYKD